MKRRDFLLATAALAGGVSPRVSRAQTTPCPPPALGLSGGGHATSSCPSSGTVPSWAQGAVNQWVTIPNTTLSSVMYPSPGGESPGIFAYSAGALHPTALDYYVIGGGHSDYAGNDVYKLNLSSSTPTWTPLHAPTYASNGSLYGAGLVAGAGGTTDTSVPGWCYYWDGRPASTHTWATDVQVISSYGTAGQLLRVGAGSVWGNGNGEYINMDAWDIASQDYTWINPNPVSSPNGPNPNFPLYAGGGQFDACVQDKRGNLWIGTASQGTVNGVVNWIASTKSWSTFVPLNRNTGAAMLYDSLRDRVVYFPANGYTNGVYFGAVSGSSPTAFTLTGTTPPTIGGGPTVAGSAWYEPGLDRYVLLPQIGGAGVAINSYYLIDPTTFNCTLVSTTVASGSTQPITQPTSDSGLWNLGNRFCYIPAYRGFVCLTQTAANAAFVRTS